MNAKSLADKKVLFVPRRFSGIFQGQPWKRRPPVIAGSRMSIGWLLTVWA